MNKPLNQKSYGHIPHLSGSRIGPGDHKCNKGQEKIACEQARKYDRVIVQEKLDGSNVGVAKINGDIIPITRAGYLADTSPYLQHHFFAAWVNKNRFRFEAILEDGERVCGEWLLVAHGTRYDLPHEPFVIFDIMRGHERESFDILCKRVRGKFIMPMILSDGPAISTERALSLLSRYGFHGALEPVEGAVWRVETEKLKNKATGNAGGRYPAVNFLVKYVYPEKIDGKYLNGRVVYNNHK